MGCHRRRDRVHRLRHLLHRNGAGAPWRSSSPPPQAPRDDAPARPRRPGRTGRRRPCRPPGRWTCVRNSRRPRTQPGSVVGCPIEDAVSQLTENPAARCSHERRAARRLITATNRRIWIHSNFVGRTCYAYCGPGQYSRHDRDTRTVSPAGPRHRGSAATATGEAAAALHRRRVGGHRCGDRLHFVGRVLLRRTGLRTSLPLPPSPRHDVLPRRPRTVAVRRARRPRNVAVRTWRPGGDRSHVPGWWSGCSDRAQPDAQRSSPQHTNATPVAAGCSVAFLS